MGEVSYDLQKVGFFHRKRPNRSSAPRGGEAWRATSLLADSLAETIRRICQIDTTQGSKDADSEAAPRGHWSRMGGHWSRKYTK